MWRVAGVRFSDVALPFALALLVSLVEGASFAFLIPLGDGVAAGSFAFLDASPRFGWVTVLVPDSMSSPQRRDLALALALLLLILLGRLLKTALELLRSWWITARDRRYITEVGREAFGRVLGFGPLYFQRRPLGYIDTEISWAASAVNVLSHLEGLLMHSIRLIVKVALVLAISVHLFAILLISIVAAAALTHVTSRREAAMATSLAALHKATHRETLDTLSNMPMVKAMEQENTVQRAYSERLAEAEALRASLRRTGFLKAGVIEATVLAAALGGEAMILLFVPGSPAGHLARFCAFFVVAQQCLPDIQEISEYVTHLTSHMPKLEALARLFDDDAKFVVPSGSRPFTGLKQGIVMRALRFDYDPATPVFSDLTTTVPAGRVTALVGATGCGKTTLANLVLRVYDCPPGAIFFDGTDARDFDLASFRQRAALVSQEPWILDRSLRHNLCFGLDAPPDDEVLWEALREVDLADHFAALPAGLDTELGSRGTLLSGGQRQRVALARVLLHDPDILVLDEATSALDGGMEERVMASVRKHLTGSTIILIAHRFSTVRMADHVLVMQSGHIVESGHWDDLAASRGVFAGLFAGQLGEPSDTSSEPLGGIVRR